MEKVARVSGLDESTIADPDARVPDDALARLWRMLSLEHPGEVLTMQMARAAPLTVFVGLAHGCHYAADLRSALLLICHNRALMGDRVELALLETELEARLVGSHPSDALDAGRMRELSAGLLNRLITEILDVRGAVERVDFSHRAWGPREAYEAFFEAPVRFQQRENAIVLAKDRLSRPFDHANAELFRFVERHFADLSSKIRREAYPAGLERLHQAIADNAAEGEFSTQAAAVRACMSLRSAQRLATGAGTTLQALVERRRMEYAERLLLEGHFKLALIAQLVGYSDDRAFRRAFKRMTGATPSEYRRSRGVG
ncbi:MAG: AraC family transcriptional regulator ligand-binding domain-containing protein [Pseudomonadota bacterium]